MRVRPREWISQIPCTKEWQSAYTKELEQWLQELLAMAKLKLNLPDIRGALTSASQAVQNANAVKVAAQVLVDELSKATPLDVDALAAAKQTLLDAKAALDATMAVCEKVANELLHTNADIRNFVSTGYDDDDLVTYIAIVTGGTKNLGAWCDASPENAIELMLALKDPELLRYFLESGGPRVGRWGPAVKIYHQLQPKDPVLKRLALACTLELSEPYSLFSTPGRTTDAVQRYVYYEQCYLLGELDAAFSTFNVFEMRQIVNSDASEEELTWGRECLRNYRPDIALRNDKWQYAYLVKSDVDYTSPDWYKKNRSYDQILSGGGKCGPRAWMGRFLCKAHGIPTWGVRQPGHAAMTRWTKNGWEVLLGGGMWKSWWEDQGGSDFLLDAEARSACGSETKFMRQVLRLQWLSIFWNEQTSVIRRKYLADPKSPWCTLGMMQRRIIVAASVLPNCVSTEPKHFAVHNKMRDFMDRVQNQTCNAATTIQENGSIIIQASSCSSPKKQTKKVLFLPCFMGGKQLHVLEDATIEFDLPDVVSVEENKTYKLSCCVCTVHRKEEPILLVVSGGANDDADSVHKITLPYTVGSWENTNAVSIEIKRPGTKLLFARQKQQYGFAFKSITLSPVWNKNKSAIGK